MSSVTGPSEAARNELMRAMAPEGGRWGAVWQIAARWADRILAAGYVSPADHAAALAQASIAPGDVRDYRRGYSEQVDRAEAAEAEVERLTAALARSRADALRDAADAFSREAVGFQTSWGSNPADQERIGLLAKSLEWLHARAEREEPDE